MAWVSFARMPDQATETLEFKLPKKFATKFITAVLISPENYLPPEDEEHPIPNVDIQSIQFSGKKVNILTTPSSQ